MVLGRFENNLHKCCHLKPRLGISFYVSTNIKKYQKISKNINKYQKLSKNIKKYQKISKRIKEIPSLD
jgi:hypothetical protein